MLPPPRHMFVEAPRARFYLPIVSPAPDAVAMRVYADVHCFSPPLTRFHYIFFSFFERLRYILFRISPCCADI